MLKKTLLLHFAMLEEALPTIHILKLEPLSTKPHPHFPLVVYHGKLNQMEIIAVTQGIDDRYQVANVGTQAAALCADAAIRYFSPHLVINAGTAGYLKNQPLIDTEVKVGDVFLSTQHFIYHDRQIPLSGYKDYGLGNYPSFNTESLAKKLKLKTGIVSTGNAFIKKAIDLETMREHGATLKDMEAAAIAWVCSLYKIPMFAVKVVTNLLDEPQSSEAQFNKNFQLCNSNLSIKVKQIIEEITG